MSEPVSEPRSGFVAFVGGIGVDWWATIVAGVIAVLAATDLLPRIPW